MVPSMLMLILCTSLTVTFSTAAEGNDFMASTTATTTTLQMKYYNDLVDSLPSLQGKCVAITGTTSGLGYWAAIATAKKGPSCLIMLNRLSNRSAQAEEDVKRIAAAGTDIITVGLDLQNITSVRAAAASVNSIVAKYGGLDVIATNAGVGVQPDKRTADGYDVTMQTNHLSHFLLTKLLMPSFHAAAAARKEVRIVTHSSVERGFSKVFGGGPPANAAYYVRSPAGSLGGDGFGAQVERYHQSKLANIAFAMAMHAKLQLGQQYRGFKALSAAPGFSSTGIQLPDILGKVAEWISHAFAMSAPDGSCSLLTAMFAPSAKSGDFYEPDRAIFGPPIKVIAEGVPLPPRFPRWELGINDKQICNDAALAQVWADSEAGLGEKFIIPEPSVLTV